MAMGTGDGNRYVAGLVIFRTFDDMTSTICDVVCVSVHNALVYSFFFSPSFVKGFFSLVRSRAGFGRRAWAIVSLRGATRRVSSAATWWKLGDILGNTWRENRDRQARLIKESMRPF